ncbi:hypothetical protein HanHA300_Chr13g0478721 [Helianthus annuus]|nr:hypothetical protein HanHA300_Chr13g0478721 [Helianthus annuus]
MPLVFVQSSLVLFLCRIDLVEVIGGSAQAGGSAAVGGDEGTLSDGEESSPDLPPVKHSDQSDDEALEVRLVRKRKAASPRPTPTPHDIRQRLWSASGQKPPLSSKAVSDLPPIGVKGSLSKHPRSSSLGSSHDSIGIPTSPSSSRVRDKTSDVGIARFSSAFELHPLMLRGPVNPLSLKVLLIGPLWLLCLLMLFPSLMSPNGKYLILR